ncbi:glycoside hydrolase family 27 protein [Paracidobacterium acidisoli]|uniref:Alpha-galactosidase n=1 Tax=Paracidobacterium acidisoli TaxID=2303751 RepID=A0A372IUK3_9BACT|nr:glycoside hydrolase family 27 protein [Paracidobacterium acidisoli]MBT9330082.1 glycoside hydrolase family 27 protein [Paracidobacterium acidisoli]
MRRFSLTLFAVSLCLAALPAAAQRRPSSALLPPMGWNSWDSYGLTVTEAEFKDNVQWLHQHLQPFGWQYVVVDEGWYLTHPQTSATTGYVLSPDGRYLPAVNRFPSAAAGGDSFQALADYVHSLGLKFGIHIIRGIPREAVEKNLPIADSGFHAADAADTSDTCAWNKDNYGVKDNEAGQAYYDSLAKLYAGWGVDFLKVDCISQPYRAAEIHMVSEALRRTGRPIVLSLSPGPTPLDSATDARRYAQMWRISDDMWDVWAKNPGDHSGFPQALSRQFAVLASWAPHIGDGHWPDADMLPIGYLGPRPGWGTARQSRLTHDEQRTLITLWSIARSPLVLGANLTRIDPFTESLLTNPEVIAVDQHSLANHPVLQTPDTVVWTADSVEGSRYVAVFNLSNSEKTLAWKWSELNLPSGSHPVRDLWQKSDLGASEELHVTLAPHASALFSVSLR